MMAGELIFLKKGALIYHIHNFCQMKLPRFFLVIITRFVVLTDGYYAEFHRILLYMGNCYKA